MHHEIDPPRPPPPAEATPALVADVRALLELYAELDELAGELSGSPGGATVARLEAEVRRDRAALRRWLRDVARVHAARERARMIAPRPSAPSSPRPRARSRQARAPSAAGAGATADPPAARARELLATVIAQRDTLRRDERWLYGEACARLACACGAARARAELRRLADVIDDVLVARRASHE